MSRGMWAMMTLLEVFDWSFSESFVHKFSAPKKKVTRKERLHQLYKYTHPVCIWSQHLKSPCSSLTAHTIRSTQAALAWQRSFRWLCSPGNPPVSWSTRCSSDWLLLNCSSTKSCTSRTNADCKSEKYDDTMNIWQNTAIGIKKCCLKIFNKWALYDALPVM